jgi:putative hemolysin
MTSIALEILIILLLILANGLFAMAEMAIVSARKARLQQRAESGDAGAAVALELAEEPDDFMSTVQIGITLIGVLAGAFGGATIAGELAGALRRIAFLAPYSQTISVALVVLGITYLSLVIGELAPKRFALNNAEQIASRIAPLMRRLSRIAAPVAHLLSLSAEAALRVVGVREGPDQPVSEEEIRIMLQEGTEVGVFEPLEEEMVEHIFRLGDRKVAALLTPRTEIVWIDLDDPEQEIQQKITASGHSRFPVARGELDDVLGLVLAKDLLARSLAGQPVDLRSVLRPALFVPENMPALDVLQRFREERVKIALVLDEYGGLQGMVTTDDILVAITGDIPEPGKGAGAEIYRREDGSWLLGGMLPLDEFAEALQLGDLPIKEVETLGGMVMTLLGRIPVAGDRFKWRGLTFEVLDMDGRRVDKVLVTPAQPAAPPGDTGH